jgi:archaellum component FlaC
MVDREEEVNVGGSSDDYEVVPMGPVRKLERRIDSIEEKASQGGAGGANEEMIRDVLDIMKSNQKIVNDMTESTHELKNSVEDLTHKMDEVVDNMNSFMDLLKDASQVDMEGEIVGDMQSRLADTIGDRMDDAIGEMQQSNKEIVESLNELTQTLNRQQASQRTGGALGGSSHDRSGMSGGRNQSSQSKGSGMNGQRQRSGGNQMRGSSSGNPGQSNERSQIKQEVSGNDRSSSGSGSRGSNDERMRKLRNRLKGDDEGQ